VENSKIIGIFILLAMAIALTIGVFARKRGNPGPGETLSQQERGYVNPPPVRADYTLMPPFYTQSNDIGLPPPPSKNCGCGRK